MDIELGSPAVTETSLISRSSSEPLLITPARQPSQPSVPSISAPTPIQQPKPKHIAPKAKAGIASTSVDKASTSVDKIKPRRQLLKEQDLVEPNKLRNKKK